MDKFKFGDIIAHQGKVYLCWGELRAFVDLGAEAGAWSYDQYELVEKEGTLIVSAEQLEAVATKLNQGELVE